MEKMVKYKKSKINIIDAIYIFLICGVLGWLVEIAYVYLYSGNLSDRGMCYGPICTIYGIGGLILYIAFGAPKKNKSNLIFVFFSSTVILGTFEMVSGLILKYVLNMEMWNYDGQFLEILNYTTVPIAFGWGLFATFYIFLLQPIILKIVNLLPKTIYKRLAFILITIYFADYALSVFNVVNNPEVLYNLVNP